jgi:hypothetical protein
MKKQQIDDWLKRLGILAGIVKTILDIFRAGHT